LLDQVDVREVARFGDEAVEVALPQLRQLSSWTTRLRRSLFGGS
jgi:chemotaxis receptor (MCP) glutamine deamidase CheD